MIRELRTIAALTNEPEVSIDPATPEVVDYEERCRHLENRLRAANHLTTKLQKRLEAATESTPSEVEDLVNTLVTALNSVSLAEAKAYIMSDFSPDNLSAIERQSLKAAKAIRQTLRDFCRTNNLPLFYSAWGKE